MISGQAVAAVPVEVVGDGCSGSRRWWLRLKGCWLQGCGNYNKILGGISLEWFDLSLLYRPIDIEKLSE